MLSNFTELYRSVLTRFRKVKLWRLLFCHSFTQPCNLRAICAHHYAKVPYYSDRVLESQARTSVAHHFAHSFAIKGLVTLHWTACADRFFGQEQTACHPLLGIVKQFLAIRAQTFAGVVLRPAKQTGHIGNCGFFLLKEFGIRCLSH